jgi:hypothetical protein
MKTISELISWQETHYEVVAGIISRIDIEGTIPNAVQKGKGTGGLYELAKDLTDEFETINAGRQWDGEFFDVIEKFLHKKLDRKLNTKRTAILWKEVRYYNFPKEADTNSIDSLRTFLGDHQDTKEDWESFCDGVEYFEGEIIE